MVYSERGTRLADNYDKPDVLPMVMVQNQDGSTSPAGLAKFRELITTRIKLIDPALANSVDTKVFDSAETLDRVCLMSGGHMRILMQLIQGAFNQIDELPITAEALQFAIEEEREIYRKTILQEQWDILAKVCHWKQADNNEQHLRLLLNRCLLEYRYYDENKKLQSWCNIHPLIEEIEQFQKALTQVKATST
jgi:hypothetical protein